MGMVRSDKSHYRRIQLQALFNAFDQHAGANLGVIIDTKPILSLHNCLG